MSRKRVNIRDAQNLLFFHSCAAHALSDPGSQYILTGSLVVENIFTIGGLGQQFVKSINNRDYPMIMATTIFLAVVMVICNLLSDIAYKVVDPRITLD